MDKLINDNVANQVRSVFKQLEEPVTVVFFGSPTDEHHELAQQLITEVTDLTDQLDLVVVDTDTDEAGLVEQYAIDKLPAMAITRKVDGEIVDYGVRIFGVPGGHEFTTLIHSLITVSQKVSPLSESTIAFLNSLEEPVKLEVFSTPT